MTGRTLENNISVINNQYMCYVEPNALNAVGRFGINGRMEKFEMAMPLEDLSIFVALKVDMRGTSIGGKKTSDGGQTLVMTWSSENGREFVNLHQGKTIFTVRKPGMTSFEGVPHIESLTTDYTNTHYMDIAEEGTSEMFGIESISVEFNNFMVPQVDMNLVDVKGVSLFAPEELRHRLSNGDLYGIADKDISGSFFKAFFTTPYPRFTLYIKGFYGQPVTYELMCQDFRADFDSKSGNFKAKANFIGYSFAFMNDVVMNALMAAPYSDYIGERYWTQKKSSGEFSVKNKAGEDVPMPTFAEIIDTMQKLRELENKKRAIPVDSSEYISISKANNESEALDMLHTLYSNYMNSAIEAYGKTNMAPSFRNGKKPEISGKYSHVFLVPNETASVLNSQNGVSGTSVSYPRLKEETDAYNKRFGKKFTMPDDVGTSKCEKILTLAKKSTKKYKVSNKSLEKVMKTDGDLKSAMDSVIKKCNSDATEKKSSENPLKGYQYAYLLLGTDYMKQISDRQQEIAKSDQNAQEKAAKENKERQASEEKKRLEKISADVYTAEAIGFEPNVENVMKVFAAHLETLIYCINQTVRYIDDEQPHRTVASLEGNLENFTDLDGTLAGAEMEVPPFPRVAKTKPGSDKKAPVFEDAWVGDMAGDYLEEDLVNGIVNGVIRNVKLTKVASVSGKSSNDVGTVQETVMQIPLTPLDMVIDGIPFGPEMKFKSDFAGAVALRMVQVLSLPNFTQGVFNEWYSVAETLGKADAVNFASFFPHPDSTFTKRLSGKTMTSDLILNMVCNDQDKKTLKERDDKKWAWDFPGKSENMALLSPSGDSYVFEPYKTSDGNVSVPVQGVSFGTANKDTSEGTVAAKGENYLTTSEDNTAKNGGIYVVIDEDCQKFRSYRDNCMKLDGNSLDSVSKFYKCFDYSANSFGKYLVNCGGASRNDPSGDYVISRKFLVSAAEDGRLGVNFNPGKGTRFLPVMKREQEKVEEDARNGKGVFSSSENQFRPLGTGNERFWTIAYHYGGDGFEYYKPERKFSSLNDFTAKEKCDTKSFSLTWFGGIGMDGSPINTATIFGQECYYMQRDDTIKAYMFLRSLPFLNVNHDTVKSMLEGPADIVPKAFVLAVGAILWKNIDMFKAPDFTTDDYFRPSVSKEEAEIVSYFSRLVRSEIGKEFVNFFTEWASYRFKTVVGPYELKFTGNGGYPAFFSRITNPDNYTNNPRIPMIVDETMDTFNMGYTSFESLFSNTLSDSFFKNYVSVGELVDCPNRGIMLVNREDSEAMPELLDELFKPYVVMVTSAYKYYKSDQSPVISKTVAKKYLNGFLEQLRKEYKKDDIKERTARKKVRRTSHNDVSTDIKLGIYKYFKALYDRWLSSGNFSDITAKKMMEGRDKFFHIIDTYYNYCGHLSINMDNLVRNLIACQTNEDVSILSFLSKFLADNNFVIMYVQNFMDLSDEGAMKAMFKPVSYLDMELREPHPNFIIMHRIETSTQLGTNMNKKQDSYMLNDPDETKLPVSITSKVDGVNGYKIPAFGVSYGKQYQNYFSDISLDMANSMMTEQSIKALFQIAGAHNEHGGESAVDYLPVGQDLYTVYTNNAYTCNVSMLGCAWVQPLMYFTLLNIPMWRGTYLIYNVKHEIRPGSMKTSFTGTRMPKVSTPQRDNWYERKLSQQNSIVTPGSEGSSADAMNPCAYNVYPVAKGTRARFTVAELNAPWTRSNNGTKTVLDNIARTVYLSLSDKETPDELEARLLATELYNRACCAGNSLEGIYAIQEGFVTVSDGTETFDETQLSRVKEWCASVFIEGPMTVSGQKTEAKRECNIWRYSGDVAKITASGQKTKPVELSKDLLSRVFYHMPVEKYESIPEGTAYLGQLHYLFEHKTTIYSARMDGMPLWSEEKHDINDRIINDRNNTSTVLSSHAWNLAVAIQNSLDSAALDGVRLHILPRGGDHELYLTLDVPVDQHYKKAILFDIILNGYYEYFERLVWVCVAPTDFPEWIYVNVYGSYNRQPNQKRVYMATGSFGAFSDRDGLHPMNLSSMDMEINPYFLGILGKKYLGMSTNVTMKECANFSSTSDHSALAEIMRNNESCAASIINKGKDGLETTSEGSNSVSDGGLIGDWNVGAALDFMRGRLDDWDYANNAQAAMFGVIAGVLNAPKANDDIIVPIYNGSGLLRINPEDPAYCSQVLAEYGWTVVGELCNPNTHGAEAKSTPSVRSCKTSMKPGDIAIFKCAVGGAENSTVTMWDGDRWLGYLSETRGMYPLENRGDNYKKGFWMICRYSGSGMREKLINHS